jgi:hypothetical protein
MPVVSVSKTISRIKTHIMPNNAFGKFCWNLKAS